MLIKKNTRKEKKKREEDIPESGGEEVEDRREEKEKKGCWCFLHEVKKKKNMLVCYEIKDSIYWSILPMILLMDN